MGGSTKDAWDEVGESFAGVGRRLSERYKTLAEERTTDAAEDARKLKEALRAVTDQLDRAFTSVGDTLRDPEAQSELRKAVGSLGDAITTTFSEVGERIRTRGKADGPPTPPDQPSQPSAN